MIVSNSALCQQGMATGQPLSTLPTAFHLPMSAVQRCGLIAGGLCLLVLGASAVQAQPSGLSYPRQGVVCDGIGRVCYDSYGPSIGITKEVYGKKAANQLTRALSDSNSRDFRLSTGQACSVSRRTCWKDGWSEREVASGLTQQLFGGGGGLRPGQAQVARDSGLCSLSRSAQRVYDGPCLLKQVMQGGQNRYEVTLQNGNRYVFQQLGGRFEIRDGFGGVWPVAFVDHGNTGVFRFGDYKLVATQQRNQYGSTPGSAGTGNTLTNLLNTLFQ
ncbi:MAG: hypothetical protein RLZZ54_2186 [Cyanobacteriota bacterium]|jgi:hypothetical protein